MAEKRMFKSATEMSYVAAYVHGRLSVLVEDWDDNEKNLPGFNKEQVAEIFRELDKGIMEDGGQ